MTTCGEIQMSGPYSRTKSTEPIWLRTMRSLAAILVGIAAFFLNFGPIQAAGNPATLTKPSDARAGSLLLKTEDGGYADATRLGIDVDLTVSGPTIRAR